MYRTTTKKNLPSYSETLSIILVNMAQAPQVTGHQHEDAWDKDWIRVDDTHELYYEQYGKKDGKPGTFHLLHIYISFGTNAHTIQLSTSTAALAATSQRPTPNFLTPKTIASSSSTSAAVVTHDPMPA
jgi:hypothetical protein